MTVGYSGLHRWLSRKFGKPKLCEYCGKEGKKNGRGWTIEWANKTNKYLRERNDWLNLCHKCHYKYDKENKFIGKEKIMPSKLFTWSGINRGGPKIENPAKPIVFRLYPEEILLMKKSAKKQGISESETVRRAIRQYAGQIK